MKKRKHGELENGEMKTWRNENMEKWRMKNEEWKRSGRTRRTPGFLGTPAGITTSSAPSSVFFRPSSGGRYPVTFAGLEMWDRSAATPGVLTISNRESFIYT